LSIQASTIMSGYHKVGGVYPFDPTANKPCRSSNASVVNPKGSIIESTAQLQNESDLRESDPVQLVVSLSENQVNKDLTDI